MNKYPNSICTVLNGSKLVYTINFNIVVRDLISINPNITILKKHNDTITKLLSIHKSNYLVSAGNDSLVVLWNIVDNQVLAVFNYILSQITHLSLIPD